MTQALAPGKIILSGEHAVVYGRPALVMAVNRYVKTEITSTTAEIVEIEFISDRQPVQRRYSWPELQQLHRHLSARYDLFVAGRIAITEVLDDPYELIPYALVSVLAHEKFSLTAGMNVRIVSDIPLGCGMGSSASVSLSVLHAVAGHIGATIDRNSLFVMACACERLRHGITSGVDPYACLHGGFIKFQREERTLLPFPDIRFQLVLTGAPESSTGACVMAVKTKFSGSSIWDEFAQVTTAVEEALKTSNEEQLIQAIRHNHELLTQIGVVPSKVQQFIMEIEKRGGGAKISGAGSVVGDHVGGVIVYTQELPADLCRQFNYQILPISGDRHGTCLL